MVEYHKSSAPLPCLPNFHGGRKTSNNWGQININLVNQKGQRLMGADDLWYPTMRKPPLASAPFDWKLMLL
jgi:hypothetical protein